MIRKGFKVVEVTASGLVSTRDWAEWRSIYSTKDWTVPFEGWGPLCVFRKIGDATFFKWMMDNNHKMEVHPPVYEIWECEYSPSKRKNVWEIYMGRKVFEKKAMLSCGKELATKVRLTRRAT